MQLTPETRRTWWLVMLATWAVCAALALLHTAAVRDYVALLDAQGLRDAAEPSTPLRQVIPARHADAQMWVRHTLAAEETAAARVRFTAADNAPLGREVHWSSPLIWLLRGAHLVQHAFSGQTGPRALERALLWFNAPLLLGLIVLLSAWAAKRAGAGAGVLIGGGMIGHNRFYEGFTPTYVDHHGLINATVLGLLLGVAFMGAGWWQPPSPERTPVLPVSREQARRGAIGSALCGAVGLWLSTATVAPVIALVGTAGLVLTRWRGTAAALDGARFDPTLWQWWGRVGAAASFGFYLVEYGPAHFSLRLEVIHPLYALAWWGGAEIIAILGGRRRGQATPSAGPADAERFPTWHLTGALLAVGAAPLALLLGGRDVFLVSDPFVGELRHYVAEGRSLLATAGQFGLRPLLYDLASSLLLVPAALAVWRRGGASRILTGTLTLVVAALVLMAFMEMRWWLNAAAAQIVLLLGLLSLADGLRAGTGRRWGLAAVGVLFLGTAVQRIVVARIENQNRAVAAGDLLQPLYRDVAATLRASQPDGDIILLASPNASAGIGYFGRFQSLGTLFWENASGLRAAAEIYSASSDDEALALIRARRITHLAMVSTANFLGEYFRLLHPHSTPADAKNTFGYRLTARLAAPPWLQPVPYRLPAELRDAAKTVRLYKVASAQTEVEWRYHTAIAQLAEGDVSAAEQSLEIAVARAPAAGRFALWEAGGAAFYDYGADAAAVRSFRHALLLSDDPGVAITTAWILATSRDPAVRDGIAALALAGPLARRAPADPTGWSALAAAHAELGRFPEAVSAAARAVAAARATGDAATEGLLQRRLETFRAGRPWRQ